LDKSAVHNGPFFPVSRVKNSFIVLDSEREFTLVPTKKFARSKPSVEAGIEALGQDIRAITRYFCSMAKKDLSAHFVRITCQNQWTIDGIK
jgi:hypothetical protein